ncbi:MAG: cobalt ECF transporter T component CbiQ [Deltaproteobacteria bacterium]|nr:cobalt ECF transporter T component CbiQ [Deltaproteobacteria bacterium]
MINEYYADETAWIQRLDPRLRILFATVYSFSVALLSYFQPLLLALAFSFLMLTMAGVSLQLLKKRLMAFNGMVLLFWLVLPITFSGKVLYELGPLTITLPGVVLAAQITLKANAIMVAFIALVATTPISVIGHGLDKLYVPKKITHVLLMTYRYVFVIEQEYQRLMRAIKIRGFSPRTNMHTYQTYGYVLGMIFVRSLDRARRVHQAMICRGFDGTFYSLERFSLKRIDYICMPLMIAVIIGIEVMEWINTL